MWPNVKLFMGTESNTSARFGLTVHDRAPFLIYVSLLLSRFIHHTRNVKNSRLYCSKGTSWNSQTRLLLLPWQRRQFLDLVSPFKLFIFFTVAWNRIEANFLMFYTKCLAPMNKWTFQVVVNWYCDYWKSARTPESFFGLFMVTYLCFFALIGRNNIIPWRSQSLNKEDDHIASLIRGL